LGDTVTGVDGASHHAPQIKYSVIVQESCRTDCQGDSLDLCFLLYSCLVKKPFRWSGKSGKLQEFYFPKFVSTLGGQQITATVVISAGDMPWSVDVVDRQLAVTL